MIGPTVPLEDATGRALKHEKEPSRENYWSYPAFSASSSRSVAERGTFPLGELDLCPQILRNTQPSV